MPEPFFANHQHAKNFRLFILLSVVVLCKTFRSRRLGLLLKTACRYNRKLMPYGGGGGGGGGTGLGGRGGSGCTGTGFGAFK